MSNTTKELHELFIVVPGLASSNVTRFKTKLSNSYIPYIRPSYRQNSSIDAFVNNKLIPEEKVFPQHTLYVSTDGQGSHTYAYVSVCEFVPNSNVSVLIPKREMSLQEKLFYAHCITLNRYKFSYGRKPKGRRLETISLPEYPPDNIRLYSIKDMAENLLNEIQLSKAEVESKNSNSIVPLYKLFEVANGVASSEVERSKIKLNENWIPYIRPSYRQNTSIDNYVNKQLTPQNKIFPKETLYVSTNGQGSHTFSYVSTTEFVPNSDVSVLIPKREMNLQEKLFYAYCITNNRYKFSYGRKPKGDRLKAILLPEFPPEYVITYNIDKVVSSFDDVLNVL